MSIVSAGFGRAWRREFALFGGWMALWTIVGLALGYALPLAFGGLAIYLAVQMWHAYILHRWLVGDERKPLEGIGVWQEILLAFNRLRQRNTKRKKKLKGIVSEFQTSTAALPDGAVVLDPQGRIVWFNQAAAALLALRSPQDLGQRVVNLVRHPRFAAYLADGDTSQGEIEVPSALHDDAVISLRIIPYGNGQQLLFVRDVSDQKQLEVTRREFVANASHELRTPLTVLRGYLEMMEEEAGEHQSLQRWQAPIHEMGGQAMRMGRIIESLLTLARVEAEGLQQRQETVDVPAMLARLVADARRAGARHHNIDDSDIEAGVALYGRPGELESVFSNLLANAIQYTGDGGDICLRWWHDQDGAYFAVTDSGIGIDSKYIPRLTERFYRVDPARTNSSGGTGLGLAIVKHCLEHHEAALAISSEINIGSTFTCHFPYQRAQVRAAA